MINASDDNFLDVYAAARLVGADFLAEPADEALEPSAAGGAQQITEIRYESRFERRALRVRNRMFPGAPMREVIDGEAGIVVRVGEDFATRERQNIPLFRTAYDFMLARAQRKGAEVFLSLRAFGEYRQGERGLHLYDFGVREREWELVAAIPVEQGLRVVAEVLLRSRGWQESLLVQRRPETLESFWITDAEITHKFLIAEELNSG